MNEPANPSLPSVLAYARAGALERAWSLFVAGGHDSDRDDPAALTLKGRLLKDRAMRVRGRRTAAASARGPLPPMPRRRGLATPPIR